MLTVSIVTYHTPVDELETCLASLTSRCISQIYIVDNGSEDKLRRWAGQHDRVVYIAADNPGFGAAQFSHTPRPRCRCRLPPGPQ